MIFTFLLIRIGLSSINMSSEKPKLIVFDLDYTLWPFWVDSHVSPPFRKTSTGDILDSQGSKIKCYPQVPQVLEKLHNEGYTLGVASRTGEIQGAKRLINLFGWDRYFTYKEIFPGSKVTHFGNMRQQSDLPYSEMIFFDDEKRNIGEISKLGVLSIYVENGVTKNVVEEGLKLFSSRDSKTSQ